MIRPVAAASIAVLAGVFILRCASVPTSAGTATVAEYCAALANYAAGCNLADPCTRATVNQCSTIASGYTPSALGAFTMCLDGVTCGDAGAAAVSTCMEYWLATIAPTDAQAKLAQGYCGTCLASSQTAGECESAFYATIDDGGAVIVPGAGYPLLPRGDSVVTNAATVCIPALADAGSTGCAAFGACELQAVTAATPALPGACAVDTSPGDDAD